MSKALPPLTWFRAFDAAARHLSFTLAAEELGFTQSAISQHVRALEDRLGTPLFLRRHRALMLTDAGRLLVPDVAAAMARLHNATERFLPSTSRPKLTIATSASIAQWLLAPHLSDFHQSHPEIAIQILTTVWPDDFSNTNADVDIRFGPPDVVGQGAILLEPSALHVVAAPRIAKHLTGPIDWHQLAKLPLIQAIGISTTWSDLAKRAKSPIPIEPNIFVDTHGLAIDLAVSGAGIALTHSLISQEPILAGTLTKLPLPQIAAEEGYYLARKTTAFPEAQEAFVLWFLAKLSLQVPNAV
ncbi:MAG: LysR substrate-binding domain-containing protein [Sulfitobacter sp.]